MDNNFTFSLTEMDLTKITESIDNAFAQMVGNNQSWEIMLIQMINQYLVQLNALQSEVITLRDSIVQQNNSTMIKMAQAIKLKDKNNKQKKMIYNTMKQNQIFQKLKVIFATGYHLVNKIREYITGQTIQYHVGIERGKTRSSIIYTATEEHIVNNLKIDSYRFIQALFSGQSQELDFNARYTAAVKRSQINNETSIKENALPKEGTTLWSKGYRVFLVAKQNPELSAYVNFGHFLETYYYFGGNKNNRKVKHFNAIEFYQYMIALQNTTPFYQAGDFQDIQLKSNTATIANITTIKEILIKILNVLNEYKGSKKNKIKNMLTTRKQTKQQLAQKASKIEIPEDLRKELLKLQNNFK